MKHGLHGDVSPKDLELAEELIKLEILLDNKTIELPLDILAKCYVCLANDWYALHDEETGSFILEKVNKIYPDYFKKIIQKHIKEDQEYAFLINKLSENILFVLKDTILLSKTKKIGVSDV